ncbi:hypothetical protein J2Z18_006090 [Paenibacillus lactis]|uniref:Uncharacterized protein n=1 Tax=Paenibacillus lactis TaxID=228574 RepID=A0ABS4FL89_9BACL|nr:hypothetical protein [Paenibacillus lactis]
MMIAPASTEVSRNDQPLPAFMTTSGATLAEGWAVRSGAGRRPMKQRPSLLES